MGRGIWWKEEGWAPATYLEIHINTYLPVYARKTYQALLLAKVLFGSITDSSNSVITFNHTHHFLQNNGTYLMDLPQECPLK